MSLPAFATGAALAEIARKTQSKSVAEIEPPIFLLETFEFIEKAMIFFDSFQARE
jgi:hypothetical protein